MGVKYPERISKVALIIATANRFVKHYSVKKALKSTSSVLKNGHLQM